jgi:hypothetical protein
VALKDAIFVAELAKSEAEDKWEEGRIAHNQAEQDEAILELAEATKGIKSYNEDLDSAQQLKIKVKLCIDSINKLVQSYHIDSRFPDDPANNAPNGNDDGNSIQQHLDEARLRVFEFLNMRNEISDRQQLALLGMRMIDTQKLRLKEVKEINAIVSGIFDRAEQGEIRAKTIYK